MSEWTDGYRAALGDVERLLQSRALMSEPLALLCRDLQQDALVIEHEQSSKLQRRRLAAAREALPLFAQDALQRRVRGGAS
jgi:hypothetical protein